MARRRNWTLMARQTYLTEQLKETHRNLDDATAAGSWQAVALLRRQALQIRDELDNPQIAPEPVEPDEAKLTDDELVVALVGAIGTLPDHLLGEVEEALASRTSTDLRVVGGDD